MLIILILFKFINDLFIILKVKLYKTILFYKFRLIIFINIVSSFDDIDIIREKRRNNLFIYIINYNLSLKKTRYKLIYLSFIYLY